MLMHKDRTEKKQSVYEDKVWETFTKPGEEPLKTTKSLRGKKVKQQIEGWLILLIDFCPLLYFSSQAD